MMLGSKLLSRATRSVLECVKLPAPVAFSFSTNAMPSLKVACEACQASQACQGDSGTGVPIVKYENNVDKGMLTVHWQNGVTGTYAHVWLRDNAPEPNTCNVSDRIRARVMLMQNLDTNIRPTKVDIVDGGDGIEISWPVAAPNDTTVTAVYSSNWFKERNFGDATFRRNRRGYYYEDWTHWDRRTIEENVMKTPTDFERLFRDDHYMLAELEKFMKYGFLHIVNAPKNNQQIPRFEQRMGYGFPTHLGPYEEVKHKISPSNLAYTSRTLGLHTDFPQLMTSPHVQILHCIEQSSIGGENQFCDGVRVAEEMKRDRPDLYEVLATVPIEYPDWGQETYRFVTLGRWPVITVNKESGQVDWIHYNNQIRGWFMDADPGTVKTMYSALKMFDDYCYADRNILNIKLNPGEMAMFANNRVLHGRSEFTVEPGKGGRYYHAGFLLFDPVRSHIRTLREKLGIKQHTAK